MRKSRADGDAIPAALSCDPWCTSLFRRNGDIVAIMVRDPIVHVSMRAVSLLLRNIEISEGRSQVLTATTE